MFYYKNPKIEPKTTSLIHTNDPNKYGTLHDFISRSTAIGRRFDCVYIDTYGE